MPTRKAISVLNICLAIVASIWVFEKNSQSAEAIAAASASKASVVENTPRPTVETSDDWLKILQSTSWSQGGMTVVGQNNSKNEVSTGEGTLTDQMAKDFFGQYLQASQGGQTV